MSCNRLFPLIVLLMLIPITVASPASAQVKPKPVAKKPAPKAKPSTPPAETPEDGITRITVAELKQKIARNELVAIIDARSEDSYAASRTQIKGSIRMLVDEVQSRVKEVPRAREVIIYCT